MLPIALPRRRRRAPNRTARPLGRAGGLMLVLAVALAGCAHAQASGPQMELATAYVGLPQSGTTDAYLVVRNNGSTDRLVSATSSAGGTVTLSGPARGGAVTTDGAGMRNVPAITIPGHTLIRLYPNGYHLVITGSGPMTAGRLITLTLRFAHAGTYKTAATVTNAESGGSSYLLN